MKVRVISPPQWSRKKFAAKKNQDAMLSTFAAAYMGDRSVDVLVMQTTAAWAIYAETNTELEDLNGVLTGNGESDQVTSYRAGSKGSLDSWLTAESNDGLEFEGRPWEKVSAGVAYRFRRQ